MSDLIYRQIQQAIQSGRIIQAIKLLRQVEDLNLSEAKERIESMVEKMRGEQTQSSYTSQRSDREILEASSRPRAHSHAPARSGTYNVEGDLPTEAFLFLQKGEVEKGIKVIQEYKGLNKNAAKRMAKLFYQQHPEYTSAEVGRFMGSSGLARDYSLSKTDNSSSQNQNQEQNQQQNGKTKTKRKKKKEGGGFFKTVIFFIILLNIIRAFVD